jgi:hypothetical protein
MVHPPLERSARGIESVTLFRLIHFVSPPQVLAAVNDAVVKISGTANFDAGFRFCGCAVPGAM